MVYADRRSRAPMSLVANPEPPARRPVVPGRRGRRRRDQWRELRCAGRLQQDGHVGARTVAQQRALHDTQRPPSSGLGPVHCCRRRPRRLPPPARGRRRCEPQRAGVRRLPARRASGPPPGWPARSRGRGRAQAGRRGCRHRPGGAEQRRPAYGVGQRRGERRHQPGLGLGEPGTVSLAQQGERAPRNRGAGQDEPQLVAETARPAELAVASAPGTSSPAVASPRPAAGRRPRARAVNLLTSGSRSSISVSRTAVLWAGRSRRSRPSVGSVAGSIVSRHVPSKGTARRNTRVTSRTSCGTSTPRWASRTTSRRTWSWAPVPATRRRYARSTQGSGMETLVRRRHARRRPHPLRKETVCPPLLALSVQARDRLRTAARWWRSCMTCSATTCR